jgi:hypothetical protein
MIPLTSSISIDAPADTVWAVIASEFGLIGRWATAIPASAACPVPRPVPSAPVPGRVCHTGIALAPQVTEAIVAYDERGRTLTYQATAGMPGFVSIARNRWQVIADGDRHAQVTFAAELECAAFAGGWPGGGCWPRPTAPDGTCSMT